MSVCIVVFVDLKLKLLNTFLLTASGIKVFGWNEYNFLLIPSVLTR